MIKYANIPDDWTGEQAWAVLEFLGQLEELIWDTHEEKLMELVGPQPDPTLENDAPQPDLGDDDIPF
jgi:hypothetical protein